MSTTALSLDALIAHLEPDLQAIADGHRRMTDLWHDRATDSLPILFSAPAPSGVAGGGDMRRHVESAEQMLYDQVVGVICTARAGSDAQLTIRADTGTGTLATIAGCKQTLSDFALPWTGHVERDRLLTFVPQAVELAGAGIMPRVRELYAWFRATLPSCVQLYCADTQGPFDLAHLLYGDRLFYDLYDEPAFIHSLLEKATYVYIEGTKLMKAWIDEPLDGGYHWSFAMDNGGVRACEDTSTLLSPDCIAEFVIPYQQRALEAFGGGWVHYCGNNDALYTQVLANPAARGLNFGNPERHDFAKVIPDLIEAGKFYLGPVPRLDDEALADYFRRVIGYTGGTKKGLVFMPALHGEEVTEPARVIELWRTLQ